MPNARLTSGPTLVSAGRVPINFRVRCGVPHGRLTSTTNDTAPHTNSHRLNGGDFSNFSGFISAEELVEMCQPRERARTICKTAAMAALAMTEITEARLARLESDVAHISSDVADLKTDVRGLRDEMRREFAELHKELAANSRAIIRGDLTNRIWMLLMCAAMLGVVARGLHWL